MASSNRAEYLEQLLKLLNNKPVFADFPQLAEFANRAEFGFFEQGTKVIRQGDKGDHFYVVLSGQVRAIDMNFDPPHLLNYVGVGGIFGTRALLSEDRRAATIEVVIDAHLAIFDRDDWDWLIHHDDRIETYFRNLERELELHSRLEFPGRQWDEVVVIAVKRHVLALLQKMIWPILLLIIPVMLLLLFELVGFTFHNIIIENAWLTLLTIGPFVLVAITLGLYNFFDWRNDDFIVTTKRVVHIDRILLYGEKRDEAPLVRIQDVEVVSYDLLERFFDYHDVEIKTAGAGVIKMDGIPEAEKFREAIFQERRRAVERRSSADLSAIRSMIAQRLDWQQALEKPVLAFAESEATMTTTVRDHNLPKFLDYLWPRVKVVLYEADGTVILWHKHYIVLLWSIFLPLLAVATSSYVLLASFFGFFPFKSPVVSGWWWIIFGTLTLVSLVWLAAKYDGWQRDKYLVTDRRIIDIEGTPFRLGGEKRREGTFDNIQNTYYDIPNLFYQLLNMGNVVIETAGTEATFTFDMVYDPSAVQAEIFNRMILYQQRQREQERDATTAQLVEVVAEYHRLLTKTTPLPKAK